MPPRRDGVGTGRDGANMWGGSSRDPYELPEDDAVEDENSNPAAASGKGAGVTIGKRRQGVLGGSEAKKQLNLATLFTRQNQRQQAARLTPAGMVNLGNTCYLNSVVQVLLNMVSFMGDLRDPALERLAQHLPAAGVWAALRTTADKLRTATQARPTFDSLKPAVEPSELRAAMGRRGSRWRSFAQQDAHEFLVELLEGLQSEVLAAEAAASGRRSMPLSETRCPAARNLGGCLMHTWTCSACGRCTRLKEPFSCLSLQLPAHGTVNLQDLVSEYLKEETIDKNCDGCSPSAPVPHTAQHHFWRLPRVLAVHIKRFMPLALQQQQQQQRTAMPQPPQRQGSGGGDAAAPTASPAAAAADEPGFTSQAGAFDAPGTPGREDLATAREPAAAAAAGGTARAPVASQPAVTGSREPTPPAPYVYAKVHTVVHVTLGLDLARHCDIAGRAHVHLLERLPLEPIARRPGDGGDKAAAASGSAGCCAGGGSGGSGPNPASRLPPGPTAGGTLDTAGGGSTCPSPSFAQTALQDRTVQQNGTVPPKDLRQRVLLAASKALTPGGVRLPAPHSECGTSAISTGAQAEAGDGEPTPHGGVGGGAARPGSLRRQSEQERRRSPLGLGDGGAAGPSAALNGPPVAGKCGGSAGKGACHGTPMPVSMGDLSSHTGNDQMGLPLDSVARRVGVGSAARGCAANTVGCSERKAPRPMGAGAFFGATAATEPRSGGGRGPLRRGSDGGGSQQGNGDAPARPLKRMCVEDGAATPTVKRASEQPYLAAAVVPGRRLEDLSEDEQLQLALQMSLAEEAGTTTAGAAMGSGPVGPGPANSVLDLSMPTAAATAGTAAPAGPGRCRAGSEAGGGRACVGRDGGGGGDGGSPPAGQDYEAAAGYFEGDDSVAELQDESQCGTGREGSGGSLGGRGSLGGARPASSGPAMSGASGDKNDGDASDCSADLTYQRRRKRRAPKLFHQEDMLVAAESPAVPLPQQQQQQQRRRADNGFGGEGGGGNASGIQPIAYSVEDVDDGTTALSPLSGGTKRVAAAGAGSGGGGGRDGLAVGASVAEGATPGNAEMEPADQDPDLAAALRLSMATFEAEEKERKLRSSSGGGAAFSAPHRPGAGRVHESDKEAKWARVLATPGSEDAEAAAAAGAGCSTPKRYITALGPAEGPTRPQPRRGSADGCGAGGYDDCDGGRGPEGMDALVAAVGLETDGHSLGDAGPAGGGATRRRPQASLRCNSADAGHGRAGGAAEAPFKFDFNLPAASAGAAAGNGAGTSSAPAGGLGFVGPGSRREEAVDLTGGDDEDADLQLALQMSLQEVNGQDVEMADAVAGDSAPLIMDLAGSGMDADDAIEVQPALDKPKVLLVPDSDYEDDDSDKKGQSKNGSGNCDVVEPAAGAAAAAGGGSHAANNAPQRPRRCKEVAPGGPTVSVPLAQLARYRLQGVVRHKGLTPFSGHYVADVLVPNPAGATGQLWYEHNDAVVSHVDFDRVREDAAKQGYLFFFVNAPKPGFSLGVATAVAEAAAKPLPNDVAAGANEEAS
ncbi:hypothetical protein PLESTB_000514400 [Pleodorina starrii]|uniref:USP domain-containing protein n=1 Tax=Pleodorina starrii TaxID=330485 RepID=A0A9W6BGV3_9CHLO|nr:hypothetical protein PLESTM_000377300 [Pleodorina starrii]GLC51550.1 hypothetical protein PLESTB_000514400 [Pleodorina starrii]GLC72317.1 hypothetical protein PLESTF_001234500 [Pleodorina starrii]